ncbi:hypothetical protein Nepgr_030022 [Nepenthes gracilis]|uniref:Maternal effect embryo arrest 22 n=1 Tax=Nepenthes gracilis TaxID=150966 RepID=A0AAD3TFF5_NEPGR|nr:hypothetical protein Nepgr_030022 [Nepenthes gracilis]
MVLKCQPQRGMPSTRALLMALIRRLLELHISEQQMFSDSSVATSDFRLQLGAEFPRLLLRARYLKLGEKRNALRQGLEILQNEISLLRAENLSLKKACDEERARADAERGEKEKESSCRISAESKIAALESEISSLQKDGGSQNLIMHEEVMLLQARISEREAEVDQLKHLLQEEKVKTCKERENAELEKQKAAKLRASVQSEKGRADEASKQADIEAKKAEEAHVQLKILKKEVNKARSSLDFEKSKCEDANKKLELVKQRVLREIKQRVYVEKTIAVQQPTLAEAIDKEDMEERCGNNLLEELEEERKRSENLPKELLEMMSLDESGDSRSDADVTSKNRQAQIADRDAEVSRLKLLLQEGKTEAHAERKKTKLDKSKASELHATLQYEKNRADEACKLADAEANKAKEILVELEILKKEVHEARSNLSVEKLKYEDANKELEVEKQKVLKLKRSADAEKAKAVKQKKLVEANEMRVMEERGNAKNLLGQLNEEKQKVKKLEKEMLELMFSVNSVKAVGAKVDQNAVNNTKMSGRILHDSLKLDEVNRILDVGKNKRWADSKTGKADKLRKFAEVNSKKALAKPHADNLSDKLEEDRQKIKVLEKELHQLQLSGNFTGTHTVDMYMASHIANMNILKEQLKLEKKRVKHAKQVAKLEKGRNDILLQELHRLKQDFTQMLRHLDMLDKTFCHGDESVDNQAKKGNLPNRQSVFLNRRALGVHPPHMYHHGPVMPNSSAWDASDCLMSTVGYTRPQNCIESVSGIETKLDHLPGGSLREILSRPAISSSTASFSDKQLGSQGKVASSLITSAALSEELSNPLSASRWSAEGSQRKCSENLAVVAENSIRSPLHEASTHGQKKRRILNEVESIKSMQFDGLWLHQEMEEKIAALHHKLNRLVDDQMEERRYLVPDKKGDSCAHRDVFHQTKKKSHQPEVIMHQSCASGVLREMETLQAPAVIPAVTTVGSSQACKDDIDDLINSNQDILQRFEKVIDGNYMKLLNLDNMADEECFRMAMERPLSPTLPEIDFQKYEKTDAEGSKCFFKETCCRGLSCNEDNAHQFRTSDVLNMETNSSQLKSNNSGCLSMLEKCEVLVDSLQTIGSDGSGSRAGQVCRLYDDVVKSEMQVSASNGAKYSRGLELGSAHATTKLFCVVFSYMEDISSITRIFGASRACIAQCFRFSPTNWAVQDLLISVQLEKQLTPREKVCVLFSLFLSNYCAISSSKSEELFDQECADSFSACMCSVLSGIDSRSLFVDLCDLSDLVSLVEDFVIYKRILLHSNVDSELFHDCHSRFEIFQEDKGTVLSLKTASNPQVVAAGVILASICSAVNEIEYLFNSSLTILHMSRKEPSLMLALLHVFACVCGDKYCATSSLLMAVVRTMVSFIENRSEIEVTMVPRPVNSTLSLFPKCTRCPFLEGSCTVDDISSMLLEELQNLALTDKMHQNLKLCVNSSDSEPLISRVEAEQKLHGGNHSPTCNLGIQPTPAAVPGSGHSDNFYYLSNIISLLELISSMMSWDWTCNKTVPRLLRILESTVVGNFSAAIVLLLCQLGRLGIQAAGYNDAGVKNIHGRLSSFLCQISTSPSNPSLVAATVSALLGLSSDTSDEFLQSSTAKLPGDIGHPAASDIIKKPLSSLSSAQKSFFMWSS